MTEKRATAKKKSTSSIQRVKPTNSGDIDVKEVKGAGIAIGHGANASADVRITSGGKNAPAGISNGIPVRLVSFVLAAVGLLGGIALVVRLLNGFDPLTTLGLVLAVLVALLGIMGVIKPDGMVSIFEKILKR